MRDGASYVYIVYLSISISVSNEYRYHYKGLKLIELAPMGVF